MAHNWRQNDVAEVQAANARPGRRFEEYAGAIATLKSGFPPDKSKRARV